MQPEDALPDGDSAVSVSLPNQFSSLGGLLADVSPYRMLSAQYTTAAEVLLTPFSQLAHKTGLSQLDVEQLVFDLSQAVLAREEAECCSISQLAGSENERSSRGGRISFGDSEIDLLFDGGVRVGSLTEIAGQS